MNQQHFTLKNGPCCGERAQAPNGSKIGCRILMGPFPTDPPGESYCVAVYLIVDHDNAEWSHNEVLCRDATAGRQIEHS